MVTVFIVVPRCLLAILVVEKMSSSVKNVLVLDNDNMSGCYDDVLHYLFFVIRCAQSFRVSEEEIIGEAAVLAMQAFVFRPGIMFFLRDVAPTWHCSLCTCNRWWRDNVAESRAFYCRFRSNSWITNWTGCWY